MRARVTDPAVLTGPAHLNTFKVEAVEMPSGSYEMPSSFTLAKTADTKVSLSGRTIDNPEKLSWRSREIGNDRRSEFETYDLKIPLK